MSFIPVHELKPGMILAGDLLSTDGKVLLKKGSPLSPPYIQKLQSLKLAGAEIEGSAAVAPAEDEPTLSLMGDLSDELVLKVEKKFQGLEDSEIIRELKALTLKHLKEMTPNP